MGPRTVHGATTSAQGAPTWLAGTHVHLATEAVGAHEPLGPSTNRVRGSPSCGTAREPFHRSVRWTFPMWQRTV
eukprot:9484421-Pyramimonas_sp.AAC.1